MIEAMDPEAWYYASTCVPFVEVCWIVTMVVRRLGDDAREEELQRMLLRPVLEKALPRKPQGSTYFEVEDA